MQVEDTVTLRRLTLGISSLYPKENVFKTKWILKEHIYMLKADKSHRKSWPTRLRPAGIRARKHSSR